MKSDPTTPLSLEGKRALVTGGTTGIGRATAILLARNGSRVFICGRNAQHLADALADGQQERGEVGGMAVDLATEEGVSALFEGTDEWLGGLDIAVLNAGLGANGDLGSMDPGECRELVSVNLAGYIACAREAIRRMNGRGGQIVMIGSMSVEEATEKSSVYVATKAGIQGFARSLRKEANQAGIRVSLIEPGLVGTDMVDPPPEEQREMQADLRMLRAEDIARSILFILTQPARCDVVHLEVRPHLQPI